MLTLLLNTVEVNFYSTCITVHILQVKLEVTGMYFTLYSTGPVTVISATKRRVSVSKKSIFGPIMTIFHRHGKSGVPVVSVGSGVMSACGKCRECHERHEWPQECEINVPIFCVHRPFTKNAFPSARVPKITETKRNQEHVSISDKVIEHRGMQNNFFY